MTGTVSVETEVAIRSVRTASELCRKIQQEMITPAISKVDRSPVTIADFASQAVVARMLSDHDPEAVLVGEVDSTFLRQSENQETLGDVTRYD